MPPRKKRKTGAARAKGAAARAKGAAAKSSEPRTAPSPAHASPPPLPSAPEPDHSASPEENKSPGKQQCGNAPSEGGARRTSSPTGAGESLAVAKRRAAEEPRPDDERGKASAVRSVGAADLKDADPKPENEVKLRAWNSFRLGSQRLGISRINVIWHWRDLEVEICDRFLVSGFSYLASL